MPRQTRSVGGIPSYAPAPPPPQAGFSLGLGDIYYVLFRHKWKILICSIAGFAAAVWVFKSKPAPYQSEAKLFIKYVVETKAVGVPNDTANTYSLDRSDTLMGSEMEILGSLDLAQQVAASIGPSRLLAKFGGGDSLVGAANVVKNGLLADAPMHGNVLRVAFEHPDPQLVQPVLRQIIEFYLKKHAEIHHAEGLLSDSLIQETDKLRQQLADTEAELHTAYVKAGVISLEDTKKTLAEQIARTRDEIFSAEADLAERSSVLETFNRIAGTETPAIDRSPEPTPEQATQYRSLVAHQESLRKREQDLLIFFTEENSRVKQVREQLAEAAVQRKKMETDLPKLTRVAMASALSPTTPGGSFDPKVEAARIAATQAKIKILNSQMDEIRAEASRVEQMDGTISELRRKKELLEANYKTLSSSLEAKRIDDTLSNGGNIVEIQSPSPPLRDWKKTFKQVGGFAVSGLLVGLGWAFLIELYLDRSIRRPIHVERMARLPLFLSIPVLGKNERKRLTSAAQERLMLMGPDGATAPSSALAKADGDVAPLNDGALLHPFHETLRDRLISYFESKGLTHKPKLVAVTGLGRSSGVTTTAAGLAATLSETGDGNVLLVDMTVGQGSAQQFYKGKGVVGLEEVLDARNQAQIQDNLFVVGENANGDKLSRILPQRFNRIVPKLKASNFDYIIFDMPPVSQLSITPRLASYMDMVLLVLESEKTGQDVVQRAVSLLAESKAHVGAVLNKTKNYVPTQLHEESLGNI
ncbi:MAG TPA: hypothetical protein VGM73_11530 [Candidatus Didemnitutus sp.]|jgi:uncharacterized protein involved in exopolysaccharide biosynthesis/Mrp family chromosome partitioning ATPase